MDRGIPIRTGMTLRSRLLFSFAAVVAAYVALSVFASRFAHTFWAALIAFAAAGAISYFLLASVLKPVKTLTAAIDEIATGPTLREINILKAPPEIRELVDAFNRMQESIRERRRLNQEKLIRSDRLAVLGQLSAGVAHEINNPLGSIMLFTRLVMQQTGDDGTIRQNLEQIEKETRRCHAIVQSLLDFSRQREPKAEPVDVNQLLDETAKLLQAQPQFQNIEVVRRFGPEVHCIMADRLQIQQVLMNILLNAADAMNGSGTLTLETTAAGGTVDIGISDTGCGILPENLDRIFDPFFTTKEVGRGTGLGLSVSYGIVQAHNGEINVTSTPGKGSRFIVTLPKTGENV